MARPKLGETETERLHVKITAEEIEAIDNWRYTHRAPSRSEAVRRLIQIGLIGDETAVLNATSVEVVFSLLAEFYDRLVKERNENAKSIWPKGIKDKDKLLSELHEIATLLDSVKLLTSNTAAKISKIQGEESYRKLLTSRGELRVIASRRLRSLARAKLRMAK